MVVAGNIYQDVDITWGDGRDKILNNGNVVTLSLDKASGSGFQSKNEYLFGKFDMQLKLVPGNSAGTVTIFYASTINTLPALWNNIFFSYLLVLAINIILKHGKGNREQQFYLWVDPTTNFHTYSVLWNLGHIV